MHFMLCILNYVFSTLKNHVLCPEKTEQCILDYALIVCFALNFEVGCVFCTSKNWAYIWHYDQNYNIMYFGLEGKMTDLFVL